MRWTRVPLALVTIVGALQIVTPIRGAVREATASADVTEGEAGTAPAADYLEKYSRPFRIDTREFRYTETYYWRRLSHPTADDRRLGGAVLAVAFALWSGKDEIQRDMAQRDTPVEHQAALKTIEKLGGGAVVPATALLMYVGGSAFRDYRAKETGFMLAQSLLLTDLVTLGGRWVLAEDRPKYGGSLRPFHGVGGGISGHSATAASISGVLSRMYLQVTPDDGPAGRAWKGSRVFTPNTRSATRSPTAGPCLKPCPEPPPAIHALAACGCRSMMNRESGEFSYWQTRASRRGASLRSGKRNPR